MERGVARLCRQSVARTAEGGNPLLYTVSTAPLAASAGSRWIRNSSRHWASTNADVLTLGRCTTARASGVGSQSTTQQKMIAITTENEGASIRTWRCISWSMKPDNANGSREESRFNSPGIAPGLFQENCVQNPRTKYPQIPNGLG